MKTNLHELEMRNVYATTLAELADENPNILVMEADLSKASGTNPVFLRAHPDRLINCGVAEANMIGIAAGLAVEGKIPFCASFTPFATRRVYDQITISVAYANANVKIVGTAPGITTGAVCEGLAERHPVRVKRLGVSDRFGEIGTEAYLFNKHGFGVEHIKETCHAFAHGNKEM